MSSPSPAVALPVAQPVVKKKSSADQNKPIHANNNTTATAAADINSELDAEVLLQIPGVECYRLNNGKKQLLETGILSVLTTTVPTPPVTTVTASASASAVPAAAVEHYLLQMKDFNLALESTVPILEMSARNYIFPDLDSNNQYSFYGLVFPANTGADIVEIFQTILQQNCQYKQAIIDTPIEQLPTVPDTVIVTSNTASKSITTGSAVVISHLESGSRRLATAISDGSKYLKSKIKKSDKPTEISTSTKNKLKAAKLVTTAGMKISKTLVIAALATATALSKELSAALNETDIVKSYNASPSTARGEAAKDLAKSTLTALVNINDALFSSGLLLLNATAVNTAELIEHRYGSEAGASASVAAHIVTNIAHTAVDMKSVGVKAIVKSTVKHSAIELLSTEEEKAEAQQKQQQQQQQQSQSLLPSIGGLDPMQAMSALSAVNEITSVFQSSSISNNNSSSTITTSTTTVTSSSSSSSSHSSKSNDFAVD